MDEPQVPGQPKPPEPPSPTQVMTKTHLSTSVAFFVASVAATTLMYAVLLFNGVPVSLLG